MSAPTVAARPLTPACQARADAMADLAARAGITPTTWPPGYDDTEKLSTVARNMAWDAHAATEYPRPAVQDAANLAALAPELAATVWHHTAGATIASLDGARWCCTTPAAHRDALTALARDLRAATDPPETGRVAARLLP